jgi:hypothetical protein
MKMYLVINHKEIIMRSENHANTNMVSKLVEILPLHSLCLPLHRPELVKLIERLLG